MTAPHVLHESPKLSNVTALPGSSHQQGLHRQPLRPRLRSPQTPGTTRPPQGASCLCSACSEAVSRQLANAGTARGSRRPPPAAPRVQGPGSCSAKAPRQAEPTGPPSPASDPHPAPFPAGRLLRPLPGCPRLPHPTRVRATNSPDSCLHVAPGGGAGGCTHPLGCPGTPRAQSPSELWPHVFSHSPTRWPSSTRPSTHRRCLLPALGCQRAGLPSQLVLGDRGSDPLDEGGLHAPPGASPPPQATRSLGRRPGLQTHRNHRHVGRQPSPPTATSEQ